VKTLEFTAKNVGSNQVYCRTRETGTPFKVRIGQPHFMYVIIGQCKIESNEDVLLIQGGEFAYITPNDYSFHIMNEEEMEFIRVYKLPASFVDQND
jgi:quercetin dioxygenase-like cupin family protein